MKYNTHQPKKNISTRANTYQRPSNNTGVATLTPPLLVFKTAKAIQNKNNSIQLKVPTFTPIPKIPNPPPSEANFSAYSLDELFQKTHEHEKYIKQHKDSYVQEQYQKILQTISTKILIQTQNQMLVLAQFQKQRDQWEKEYSSKDSSLVNYSINFWSEFAGGTDLPSSDLADLGMEYGHKIRRILISPRSPLLLTELKEARNYLKNIRFAAENSQRFWDRYMTKIGKGASKNIKRLKRTKLTTSVLTSLSPKTKMAYDFLSETLGNFSGQYHLEGKSLAGINLGEGIMQGGKKVGIRKLTKNIPSPGRGARIAANYLFNKGSDKLFDKKFDYQNPANEREKPKWIWEKFIK